MQQSLPHDPNLRHIANQAKDLRNAHQRREREAAARIAAQLPRLADADVQDVLAADFGLQEAQHVIAKEYGFSSWKQLAAFVAALQTIRDNNNDEAGRDTRWPQRVAADFSRAEAEARAAVREAHKADKSLVKVRIDADVGDGQWDVRLHEIRSAPMWENAGERGTTDSYAVGTFMSSNSRRPAQSPAKSWIEKEHYAAMQPIHADFCRRLSDLLGEFAGTAVSVDVFGEASMSEYAPCVNGFSADGQQAYRFAIGPAGGPAMFMTSVPLLYGLLGKNYAGQEKKAGLSLADLRRLDGLLPRLLEALQACWSKRVAVQVGRLTSRINPIDDPLVPFDGKVISVALVVQCERASQMFDLYYTRSALEPVLPGLLAA